MSANDYADFLFTRMLEGNHFDDLVGDSWVPVEDVTSIFQSMIRQAFEQYGFNVTSTFDDLADTNVKWLTDQRVLLQEGDIYTGVYLKLNKAKKVDTVRSFLATQDVSKRINALGEGALKRALNRLYEEGAWLPAERDRIEEIAFVGGNREVPASDRVVTLSDNQVRDLDNQASEIIDAVSAQNQIDQSPGLRELVVGQLRAGRELLRAGSFRLYIIEVTLVDTLNFLVTRYEGALIGGLASTLIAALAKQIGINS